MRANSGISANDENGNVFTGVTFSGAGRSSMIVVSFGGSGAGGSVLMSAGVSSDGDGRLLSITSISLSFSNGGAVKMVGGESLVSIGEDAIMSAGSYVSGSEKTIFISILSNITECTYRVVKNT